MKLSKITAFAAATFFATCVSTSVSYAVPGVIVTPVGCTVDAGGPGFDSCLDTINHRTLTPDYVSNVTGFDSYTAGGPLLGPQHTQIFSGFEWFSNLGVGSAIVTYDLGSPMGIVGFALWNEETSGIGIFNLTYSVDSVNFFPALLGAVPTDNALTFGGGPGTGTYGPDVWHFSEVFMQYGRLSISGCPQPNGHNDFVTCAIGEVAFHRPLGLAGVPEPSTLALFGVALAGFAALRRRKARKAAT